MLSSPLRLISCHCLHHLRQLVCLSEPASSSASSSQPPPASSFSPQPPWPFYPPPLSWISPPPPSSVEPVFSPAPPWSPSSWPASPSGDAAPPPPSTFVSSTRWYILSAARQALPSSLPVLPLGSCHLLWWKEKWFDKNLIILYSLWHGRSDRLPSKKWLINFQWIKWTPTHQE